MFLQRSLEAVNLFIRRKLEETDKLFHKRMDEVDAEEYQNSEENLKAFAARYNLMLREALAGGYLSLLWRNPNTSYRRLNKSLSGAQLEGV